MALASQAPTKQGGRKKQVRAKAGFRQSDMLAAFFVAAAIHLVLGLALFAGVAAGLIGWIPASWAGLHLVFVGGISQLIIGTAQFFAGAFLASGPPPRSIVGRQLVAWNIATWLILSGEALEVDPLVDLGAVFLLAGLAFFVQGLRDLRRRSLQTRPWATRWFMTCAAALSLGTILGVLLAHDSALGRDLLGAHITLNVGGWMGIAIVGTLHTFFPSLTETMLRFPRLEPPTFACWCGGVALLAAGLGAGIDPISAAALVAMSAAAVMLGVNLVASVRAAGGFDLSPRLLLAGHMCLIGALAIASVQSLTDGSLTQLSMSERKGIGTLLVGGWVGLTVVGSLLHLVPILVRVRNFAAPPPAPAAAWTVLLAPLAFVAVTWRAGAELADVDLLSRSGAIAFVLVYIALGGQVMIRYRRLTGGSIRQLLMLKEQREGV